MRHCEVSIFEPAHATTVLLVGAFSQYLSMHALSSIGDRNLEVSPNPELLPYFIWASIEGSGEFVHMRRLIWAFTARICNKYQNRMSWYVCLPATGKTVYHNDTVFLHLHATEALANSYLPVEMNCFSYFIVAIKPKYHMYISMA